MFMKDFTIPQDLHINKEMSKTGLYQRSCTFWVRLSISKDIYPSTSRYPRPDYDKGAALSSKSQAQHLQSHLPVNKQMFNTSLRYSSGAALSSKIRLPVN